MPSANALRAGKAVIELSLLSGPIEKQLKSLASKISTLGASFTKVGAVLTAAGGAITGALTAAVVSFASAGSELNDLAGRTAVSVESLQRLGYAARQNGGSMTDLETAFKSMNKLMLHASRDMAAAITTLEELGLSLKDLQALTPEQRFLAFADAISKVEDPGRRVALAMKAFGGSGEKLLPTLSLGANGIAELTARAEQLGLVMSTADVTAADSLGDALDSLKEQFAAMKNQIGAALAGELTELVARATEIGTKVIGWIKNNRELTMTIAKVAVGVTAAGVALVALGQILSATAISITAVSAAMAFLAANPAVLTVAAIAAISVGLGTLIAKYDTAGKVMHDWLARNEAMRDLDKQRIGQLQTLAEKQKLTTGEQQSALDIVSALEDRYGDLGIEIDKATGAITGMAAAQEKLNAAMKADAIADVQSAIEQSKAKMAELRREFEANPVGEIGPDGPTMDQMAAQIPSYNFHLEQKRLDELQAKLNALQSESAAASPKVDATANKDIKAGISKAFKWVGERIGDTSDGLAGAKQKLTDALKSVDFKAQKKVRPLAKATKAVSDMEPGTFSTEAIFDTRFARQMFGGARTEELDALHKIERNTRRRQGGLAVV